MVVDDDEQVRCVFVELLENNGYSTIEASNGKEAIALFKDEGCDTVLLDYKMPGINGIDTMIELRKINPAVPVVIITAHAEIASAVKAIKCGAYDFIMKPTDTDTLILTIGRAIEKFELEREVSELNTTVAASMEYLLGKSKPIQKVILQIIQVASSDFSIIIEGETGSGKSVVAELIHNLSKRHNGPFVKVDMGAIAEGLVESELFGHAKGAFTGADKEKKGYFEAANKGTLFIDELQNTPACMQSKLLGAVEQGKIYPVGRTEPVDVDVRIVVATNADLYELVKRGGLREDLFYRLNEFVIRIPPLRERRDDIPSFAMKFCVEACSELKRPTLKFSEDTIALLVNHTWTGNIRELKNVMRRAALISNGTTILPEHIEFSMTGSDQYDEVSPTLPLKKISALATMKAEKEAIAKVLKISKGNKTKVASILQVDYKTILTKIKQYHLD
jgi:DNA-binding NtrC family response regulator